MAVGDAAGGPLEFSTAPSQESVESGIHMRGGGPHDLSPGQITDDTELALALADGLVRGCKGLSGFPTDCVATSYSKWFLSSPFDIGMTCSTAFRTSPGPHIGGRMTQAATTSAGSKANGALMRCIPISIATCRSLRDTVDFARKDAFLSHPNPTCQNANIAYCAAVAHLLVNPKDVQGALSKAASTARTIPCDDDVASWIFLEDLGDVTSNAGFVKHAFALAFWHLRHGTDFEFALRDVLRRGGDTDTNGAIVGGMMGAYWGAAAIPQTMKTPVLSAVTRHGRPGTYHPSRIPELVNRLSCLS